MQLARCIGSYALTCLRFLSCLLSALIAQALGNMEGERPCGWDPRYDDLGGCWIHKGALAKPGTKCYDTAFCVYKRLFTFIDEAAAAAKEVADVLVVSAMADVDALYEKIDRAGDVFAPSLDAVSYTHLTLPTILLV